jgi:tripartite-type tricarboxylate transporter receptor subunit TctC
MPPPQRSQENAVKTVRFIAATALALGAEPMLNTPAQFADWMKSESAKWAKVVKQANLKIQ